VAEPAPSNALVPIPAPWMNGSDELDGNFANDAELGTFEVLSSLLSHFLSFVITFEATPAWSRVGLTDDDGMENRMWRW